MFGGRRHPPGRRLTYPLEVREEAFALYCQGLTRKSVTAAMRDKYGAYTPSEWTIKRWMKADRWVERRRQVWLRQRAMEETEAALADTPLMGALEKLRQSIAEKGIDLVFKDGAEAVRALQAVQKMMGDLKWEADRRVKEAERKQKQGY